jgi:hypothetical protein
LIGNPSDRGAFINDASRRSGNLQPAGSLVLVTADTQGATVVVVEVDEDAGALVTGTTTEVFATTIENLFEAVLAANFPFAFTLRRTTQDPFAFVVNFPFFRLHEPLALQVLLPLELVDARDVTETDAKGRNVETFHTIFGDVAAIAMFPDITIAKAIPTATNLPLNILNPHKHSFD